MIHVYKTEVQFLECWGPEAPGVGASYAMFSPFQQDIGAWQEGTVEVRIPCLSQPQLALPVVALVGEQDKCRSIDHGLLPIFDSARGVLLMVDVPARASRPMFGQVKVPCSAGHGGHHPCGVLLLLTLHGRV